MPSPRSALSPDAVLATAASPAAHSPALLVREVPARRRHRRSPGAVVATLLGATLFVLPLALSSRGRRMPEVHGFTAHDRARITLESYAYQATARWAQAHRGEPCPRAIWDLAPYLHDDSGLDPWGEPYALLCTPGPRRPGMLVVMSAGPDRTFFTDDDLRVRR